MPAAPLGSTPVRLESGLVRPPRPGAQVPFLNSKVGGVQSTAFRSTGIVQVRKVGLPPLFCITLRKVFLVSSDNFHMPAN